LRLATAELREPEKSATGKIHSHFLHVGEVGKTP
jgi:hypothetical protein